MHTGRMAGATDVTSVRSFYGEMLSPFLSFDGVGLKWRCDFAGLCRSGPVADQLYVIGGRDNNQEFRRICSCCSVILTLRSRWMWLRCLTPGTEGLVMHCAVCHPCCSSQSTWHAGMLLSRIPAGGCNVHTCWPEGLARSSAREAGRLHLSH